MNRVLPLLLVTALAGCIQSQIPQQHPEIPAFYFDFDEQLHVLIVRGVECCSATWENVTIAVSGDPKCSIETPGSGLILGGQVAHVLGGDDIDCTVQVSYNAVDLGSWSFGPTERQRLAASMSKTWTASSNSTSNTNTTTQGTPP